MDSLTLGQKSNSILFRNENRDTLQTLSWKIPPHQQGFFCDWEDALKRKKVPIDFGLKLKE
jgi:hypothetical protein